MEKKITINSKDGFPLGALLIENSNPKGIVMMNGGTGIKKEFYLKFCRYVASKGYTVVLYDYRGIGESKPLTLRGFEAYMREWGEKDMVGVLNWISVNYPKIPIYVFAHSMGGQLIGLMENHHLIKKIVTIGSSVGYWKIFPAPFKYFCAFIWYFFVPLSSSLYGYVPVQKIRQGENLPKGVAKEWADWCKNKEYFSPFFGKTIEKQYFKEINTPIDAIWFSDDPIANDNTVPPLIEYYSNTNIQRHRIEPQQIQQKFIGHFGFFSSKVGSLLWDLPIQLIER
jgi:predicted alpha/beta hydrolase